MSRSWSRRRVGLGAVLLAGLVLAVIWLGRARATGRAGNQGELPWPEHPVFELEVGVERAYTIEIRSEGSLQVTADGREPARGTFSLEASGVLVLRPYAGGAEAVDVGARLVQPRVTINGEVPSYAGVMDVPFSFRLDRRGRFTGLTFPPGLPREASAVLEQVLIRLQVVLPHQRQTTWRTRERDAAGIFRAAYSVSPGHPLTIGKTKLEYLPLEEETLQATVVESHATFELEPGLRGVRQVSGTEILRGQAASYARGAESVRFRFQLTESPVALPSSFGELARLRDGARVALATGSADPRLPEGLLSGLRSLGDTLKRFHSLFAKDRSAAEALALVWLRRHAGAPGELVGLLDGMNREPTRSSLGDAERSVLWRLLAQAGTPEAEGALLDAAVSPAHPVLTRRQAIMHFNQVAVARSSAVDGLLGIYDGRDQAGPEGSGLGSLALLAAGALGHRSLASPELTRSVSEALRDRLARAAGNPERLDVLAAIGNVGDPSLLPVLSAELSGTDPGLRAEAIGGFRRMEGAAARQALMAHAAVETDATVRARVVQTLQRLETGGEAIAWASAEVGRERDPRVLLALVDLLGASRERSPEAVQALQGILQRPGELSVKRRVLRYIPSEPRITEGR